MNQGRPRSVRRLLFVLLVVGIVVWLAAIAALGSLTFRTTSTTNRVLSTLEPAAEAAGSLAVANSDMQRGLGLYVLDQSKDHLDTYVAGERQSSLAIAELNRLLSAQTEARPLLETVTNNRNAWIETVAKPTLADVRADDIAAATIRVTGEQGQQYWDALDDATSTLVFEIDSARTAGFTEVTDLTQQLGWALLISVVVLTAVMTVAVRVTFSQVLQPLEGLRAQIRAVARKGDHDQPISLAGPAELAAVAADTEALRRQLVEEIDEARSARQALDLHAPLVTAIRRELAAKPNLQIAGLSVAGQVQAAEGVLAGDWYDWVEMPTGEVGIVIADVSGHGPEAGIIAMRTKHLILLALESGLGPLEAIQSAASSFVDESARFATAAIVCIHPRTRSLRWVNAGHHPPLVVDAKGADVRELRRTGPLLSWLGGEWTVGQELFTPAHQLFLASDGLLESHDGAGTELGQEGLIRLVQDAVRGSSDSWEWVQQVLAAARSRAIDWDRDDVTLVAAKYEVAAEIEDAK